MKSVKCYSIMLNEMISCFNILKNNRITYKIYFKEWFSTLEYFIATHWWRKWKSDTALKTAQSWYLTRRLVDASLKRICVKEDDCHTIHYKEVFRNIENFFSEKFEDRIFEKLLLLI